MESAPPQVQWWWQRQQGQALPNRSQAYCWMLVIMFLSKFKTKVRFTMGFFTFRIKVDNQTFPLFRKIITWGIRQLIIYIFTYFSPPLGRMNIHNTIKCWHLRRYRHGSHFEIPYTYLVVYLPLVVQTTC